jgi:hypothetical protein
MEGPLQALAGSSAAGVQFGEYLLDTQKDRCTVIGLYSARDDSYMRRACQTAGVRVGLRRAEACGTRPRALARPVMSGQDPLVGACSSMSPLTHLPFGGKAYTNTILVEGAMHTLRAYASECILNVGCCQLHRASRDHGTRLLLKNRKRAPLCYSIYKFPRLAVLFLSIYRVIQHTEGT